MKTEKTYERLLAAEYLQQIVDVALLDCLVQRDADMLTVGEIAQVNTLGFGALAQLGYAQTACRHHFHCVEEALARQLVARLCKSFLFMNLQNNKEIIKL